MLIGWLLYIPLTGDGFTNQLKWPPDKKRIYYIYSDYHFARQLKNEDNDKGKGSLNGDVYKKIQNSFGIQSSP